MLLKFQLLIYARNKSLIEIFVNIYANVFAKWCF